MYYEGDLRAEDADSENALVRQDSHKTSLIDTIAIDNRKSSTFFDIHLGKGDEIADYTYNYFNDGETVRTVGVMYYEGEVRASSAGTEDSLIRQDTHKTSSIDTIAIESRRSSRLFVIVIING